MGLMTVQISQKKILVNYKAQQKTIQTETQREKNSQDEKGGITEL